MRRFDHFAFISLQLIAILASAPSAPDETHYETIDSPDFKIDFLYYYNLPRIDVVCKTQQAWSSIFSREFNITHSEDMEVVFQFCDFSKNISVISVIKHLCLEADARVIGLEGYELQFINKDIFDDLAVDGIILYDYKSSKLPEDLLFRVEHLRKFSIRTGQVDHIPKNLFNHAMKLEDLSIVSNKLTKLYSDNFISLIKLKKLVLRKNEIEEIEAGTFDKLVNLVVLDLAENKLKVLADGIFRNFAVSKILNNSTELDHLKIHKSSIRIVNLNQNQLTILPDGLFKDMNGLVHLDLSSNNLTTLPDGTFFGASSLSKLDLSNNMLTNLLPKVFGSNNGLKELKLSSNELKSLPAGLFNKTRLVILNLDYNHLTNLSSSILTGLKYLQTIRISHNRLTHINKHFCIFAPSVQYIDLSYNELTSDEGRLFYLFNVCKRMEDLNLAYNKITELPKNGFSSNYKFGFLNLGGNSITKVTPVVFDIMGDNLVIDLSQNKITQVDFNKIQLRKVQIRKIEIRLDGNELDCNCKILDFIEHIEKIKSLKDHAVQVSADSVKCASPPELFNRTIKSISTTDLKCLYKSAMANDACNETCTCWDYPGAKVLSVDCSNKNLTSIPPQVLNKRNRSIKLNMTGNQLQVIPALNHSYLLSVTDLDLSSNKISTIPVDVFSENLRVLKLHNNCISRLNPEVIQYLSGNNSLQTVTLDKNRWICDCDAQNFLNLVHAKRTYYHLSNVTCHGTNRTLFNLSVDELCENSMTMILFGCSVIASLGIFLGCLAALYYKYQREVKVWLYSKQWCLWFVTEDELDKDKQYDAFISYSHKDEDFVVNEIVPKLEKGPNPYKLCLHYRDWLAGEWIPAQIAHSVEESRRTIIVLSPNFLESVWGRMEFRTAHDQALSEGRARVIMILYGEIGRIDDLDPELKTYLSLNTYVKWGDPWFWDKLRYTLPHRNEKSTTNSQVVRLINNQEVQLTTDDFVNIDKPEN